MAEFLFGLARGGVVVDFCHWVEPGDDPLATTRIGGVPGVETLALEAVRGGRLRRAWLSAVALLRLVRAIRRAQFVYLYWPGRLSVVAARVCALASRPYGLYLRGGDEQAVREIATVLRRAAFAFVAGDRLRALAESHSNRVLTVTPMLSLRPEHITAPRSVAGKQLVRILYVGRIEAAKGVRELIGAYKLLRASGIAADLRLVGQVIEPDVAQLDSKLDEGIHLIQPITSFDELADLYRTCDIFVLPSYSEGFPRVIYEAMTFGLPIVTTFVGGISAVLADDVNCLRVEVGAIDELAAKIQRICTEPGLSERLAANAQERIGHLMETWRLTHAEQVLEALKSP